MPDLGKYAFEVLLAYGGSLLMLLALLLASLAQARRTKRALEDAEGRAQNG